MSVVSRLQKAQQDSGSVICLGLDLDQKKVPQPYNASVKGLFDFANQIIQATSDHVCAYKPNLAFYESLGHEGISLLKLIRERIPEHIPVILDGKRGDIGNTAGQYARFLLEELNGDWVTLNPYMGYDSIRPFLDNKEKGVFVLCLTSNTGSRDFQMLNVEGKPLYEVVAEKVAYWNKDHTCGLVVGATHPEQLDDIRRIAGDMPLLIPGVGAQGGALEKAVLSGTDDFHKPAVINVSRSVLYASREEDFAQRARQELEKLNDQVAKIRAEVKEEQEARRSGQETPVRDSVVVHPSPEPAIVPEDNKPAPANQDSPEPAIKPQPADETRPPEQREPATPIAPPASTEPAVPPKTDSADQAPPERPAPPEPAIRPQPTDESRPPEQPEPAMPPVPPAPPEPAIRPTPTLPHEYHQPPRPDDNQDNKPAERSSDDQPSTPPDHRESERTNDQRDNRHDSH